MRIARLVFVCMLLALVTPLSALASDRMWIGFQDDPSFRWRQDRAKVVDEAAEANATVIRTTVYWSRVAPRRPANASDPFDSAYRWDDLDELVRTSQRRGMETYITIWGTPDWADRGKGPNHAPTNLNDLTNFCRALSTRYSGRIPGYPFARFYGVWNEPNLEQFLAPTYDKKGKPVAPATYARLYRAAYTGLKSGSPTAQIAVGETSPRGRDKPSPGIVQDSMAPATFARLLSLQRPRVKFDAWAQHPYSILGQGPLSKARYPNIHLTQLPRFEKDLGKWFKKAVPIWVSEYGFETKPGEPRGVTLIQQASYAQQTINLLRRSQYVRMFIWFILRDDPTSTWQSGLENRDGTRKPAYSTFAAAAKPVDARNPIVKAKVGVAPLVRIPVLELAAHNGAGSNVGANVKVFGPNSAYYGTNQMQGVIGTDGWASFQFASNGTKRTYFLYFDINDKNGNVLKRSATLVIG
jgi:Cellulase (glycosyl hydrolase family 5)